MTLDRASWPSSTTPSTRASRSSASSSSFITSGPLVAMVLEGQEAVKAARQVIGATNPLEAATGLDPRRLRDRGRPEHGPRLRLARVGRARGEPVLPRAADPRVARSPQRRAILEQLGVAVRGRAGRRRGGRRRATRRRSRAENARRKALAVAAGAGDALVLGADTLVALDGDILGKPRDAAAGARATLARLAGRTHEVVGGIALARGGAVLAEAVEVTEVTFRAARRRDARLVRGDGRVGGPGRRLRDPGPRRGARRRASRRLPQRRRAAGGAPACSCVRTSCRTA